MIEDIYGRRPPVKQSGNDGEKKTINRVKHTESHRAYGKVTALKKRWVTANYTLTAKDPK